MESDIKDFLGSSWKSLTYIRYKLLFIHYNQSVHITFKVNIMGLILLILLIVLLLGGLPRWGYSREWGYGPSGLIGTILVIYLILVLLGRVSIGL